MIRVFVKPAKSLLRRPQWKFEIRAANGERLDPRDTYNNRADAIATLNRLFSYEVVELVIVDRNGRTEDRRLIRG